MLVKTFDIDCDYHKIGTKEPQDKPRLTSYIIDGALLKRTFKNRRPAVIVCPGGGYKKRSVRESEAICLKYCAAGFHAFLLDYSVEPAEWPIPQCQLSRAIALVRGIADEYSIDKNAVYVCGFSAGGHLAASLGVHYDNPEILTASGARHGENKPNGLILCYPVLIGGDNKTHAGTKEKFIGSRPENEKYFSLDKYVTEYTPKCFIWHTFEDTSVPVWNSMMFAEALLSKNVEYELHIFPKGKHGLALGNMLTAAEDKHLEKTAEPWAELSIKWLYAHTDMGM